MRKAFGFAVLIFCFGFLTACGGNGGGGTPPPPQPPLQVTISPTSATVQTGGTQQFTFEKNGSMLEPDWFINDVQSGNSTLGTIDISGLYTAPQLPPNPATVTVKACSRSDATNCATASVTVVAGPGNFVALHFWAPQNGTATGKTASFAANGVLVAGVDAVPQGAADPRAGLVTYGADGSKLGEWVNNSQPSILTAATYDPVSGNVFAVGYAGTSANPDGHSAMLLVLSPANPANVVLNKVFQFDANGNSVSDGSGLRTEARAVAVRDGKIYLAVKSAYEQCGFAFGYCSSDWIVIMDAGGNILNKFAVGNTRNIGLGKHTEITGMAVGSNNVVVTGDEYHDSDDSLGGHYYEVWSLTGETVFGPSLASNPHKTGVLEDTEGNSFVYGWEWDGDANHLSFGVDKIDNGQLLITWLRIWNGDNSGSVSVNFPHDAYLNTGTAGGLTVVGSLSRIGSADPTQTDGGAISWDVNGNVLWKQRFTSVPGGVVNSWNGGAPAADGSINLVGSGTDGNTACGALTACGTAVIGRWLPPN